MHVFISFQLMVTGAHGTTLRHVLLVVEMVQKYEDVFVTILRLFIRVNHVLGQKQKHMTASKADVQVCFIMLFL